MARRFLAPVMLFLIIGIFAGSVSLSAPASYKEAPMLSELVKAGKLPSVGKRLPEEPMVIEPIEKKGRYGGTLNTVILGSSTGHLYCYFLYEPLVRWSPDWSKVIPNVASSWKIAGSGKEFTFYLRKGMRWSDGQPFTADDILFWYNDVVCNKDLTPVFPGWLTTDGIEPKVTKIDDYTVKFKFEKPHGLFLYYLAMPMRGEVYAPKHYMKQFHPKYADKDKLVQAAKKAGFNTWYQFYHDRDNYWVNTERPVLYAWKVKTPLVGGAAYLSLERNPYYWKVDPDGSQLPYIDNVMAFAVTNRETGISRAVTGELDFVGLPVMQGIRDYSLLMEYRKKGNYEVVMAKMGEANDIFMFFNLNHKDPVLRKIFNDRRFRIAMSHAINREELMELFYLGMAKDARQPAPLPESPFYYEPLAHAYIKYDPGLANKLLDEMGLAKRDGRGFRLRPDGKPLNITLVLPSHRTDWIDVMEVVVKHWKEIGVNVVVTPIDDTLLRTRYEGNEFDAGLFYAAGGMMPLVDTRCYIPAQGGAYYAHQWYLWYSTKGRSGETPPPHVRKQLELFDTIKETADQGKQKDLFKQILEINAEYLPCLGVCERQPIPFVVSNRLRNVPKTWWADWEFATGAPALNSCQFYLEK